MRNQFLLLHLCIVIMLAICTHVAYAAEGINDDATLYNQAGKSYLNGKFNEAINIYESLIKKGITNPDLYYNCLLYTS
ncbi:MAG TPA: hypothetical protein ENH82_18315, partial [bacterium]|nr:hypothetical protein [bacterium]